jgi:hypothetical protein
MPKKKIGTTIAASSVMLPFEVNADALSLSESIRG